MQKYFLLEIYNYKTCVNYICIYIIENLLQNQVRRRFQKAIINKMEVLQMKHFNFQKWLLMLALVILIQNSTVIVYNIAEASDACSGEGGISTLSDKPYLDDNYS